MSASDASVRVSAQICSPKLTELNYCWIVGFVLLLYLPLQNYAFMMNKQWLFYLKIIISKTDASWFNCSKKFKHTYSLDLDSHERQKCCILSFTEVCATWFKNIFLFFIIGILDKSDVKLADDLLCWYFSGSDKGGRGFNGLWLREPIRAWLSCVIAEEPTRTTAWHSVP